ncbi:hypothetical protein [Pseudomonas aeruginosa]|uniref:hypothetical protein n=1 Tax=Pseudomonas aeruginosa TaxID=287 RepID=UPI00249BB0A2|nr:hypothetical protein [Pseudomonas aeruginosa]WGX87080.1 hypothetical protein QJ960_28255 [Pseudomonas aeruginosa]
MSGNNELNQLQQQRQDLIEERERLEANLPRLENALEQAPTGWHLGNMVGSEEKQAARDALSNTRASIDSIDYNLRQLDIRRGASSRTSGTGRTA